MEDFNPVFSLVDICICFFPKCGPEADVTCQWSISHGPLCFVCSLLPLRRLFSFTLLSLLLDMWLLIVLFFFSLSPASTYYVLHKLIWVQFLWIVFFSLGFKFHVYFLQCLVLKGYFLTMFLPGNFFLIWEAIKTLINGSISWTPQSTRFPGWK